MSRVQHRPAAPAAAPTTRAAEASTGAPTNSSVLAALTTGLTPQQSHEAALTLSSRLLARKSGSTAEIALLLFHAVNSAESAGGAEAQDRVPADVQRAVREVLLALKLKPVDLKAIQEQFLKPLGDDLDEAAMVEAYRKLAASPDGFDRDAVKKLMALAWTGGRLTVGERGGVTVVLRDGSMAKGVRAALRGAFMDALLASLQQVLGQRAAAPALVDELVAQAATPAAGGRFFARTQEAFFAAATRPGQVRAFSAAAKSATDASPLELELARRLSEDANGQLHLAGLEKLLARIKANGKITAAEQTIMASLGEDPDGRAALVRALRELPVWSEPLVGKAEAALDALQGGATATAMASQGLEVLDALAKRTGHRAALPAPKQRALVDAWSRLLTSASPDALDSFAIEVLAALNGTSKLAATLAAVEAGWVGAGRTSRPNPNPPGDPITRGSAIWEGGVDLHAFDGHPGRYGAPVRQARRRQRRAERDHRYERSDQHSRRRWKDLRPRWRPPLGRLDGGYGPAHGDPGADPATATA